MHVIILYNKFWHADKEDVALFPVSTVTLCPLFRKAHLTSLPQACRYSFLLKQTVGTEDAYLGLGNKDPSSNCCEDLVLKVELPGIDSIKGSYAPSVLTITTVPLDITH